MLSASELFFPLVPRSTLTVNIWYVVAGDRATDESTTL